jgi:membrane associated rhomboid family serine protease
MSARADEIAAVDAWQGARIGFRTRQALIDAHRRSYSEIDLGEPAPPRIVILTLLASLFATLVEFQKYGTHPTAQQLDAAGASSVIALVRGDWSSIVTANLLHAGIQHFALNAFIIYLVGRWVEHVGGRWVTAATVTVGALGTVVGSLITTPTTVTIGASGIAFALLGCGLVLDPRARTGLGLIVRPLLVLNVVGTFVVPGVSVGGHIGGLAAGLAVGLATWSHRTTPGDEQRSIGSPRRAVAIPVTIAASLVLAWSLVWHTVDRSSARDAGVRVAMRLVDSKSQADAG